jgi:predicted dehydrogenase
MSKTISRRQFAATALTALAGFSIVPRRVLGGRGITAPSDKMTLGFIGTGRQSRGLAENFIRLDEVQLVAGSDIYRRKLEVFRDFIESSYRQKSGDASWAGFTIHDNYLDILSNPSIDGVIIALPDHWHALPSIQAANAGKHVYCEKPLSHTVMEGRAMVNAARKNNIVLQTGSMQRSWKIFRHACELVRNGYIGEVKKVLVSVGDPAVPCDLPGENLVPGLDWYRWIGPAPARLFNSILAPPPEDSSWPMWRKYSEYGGGILSDWGAHMFDIAQWALGMDDSGPVLFAPPEEKGSTRGLVMRYANGIEMVHAEFGRGWGVEFQGSEGVLQVSRDFLDTKPETIASAEIKESEVHLYKSENHYLDWIDAIKKGSKPVCDVEIGHRSASVCNLANIAYQLRKELAWDPVSERFTNDNGANKHLTKKYRKGFEVPV